MKRSKNEEKQRVVSRDNHFTNNSVSSLRMSTTPNSKKRDRQQQQQSYVKNATITAPSSLASSIINTTTTTTNTTTPSKNGSNSVTSAAAVFQQQRSNSFSSSKKQSTLVFPFLILFCMFFFVRYQLMTGTKYINLYIATEQFVLANITLSVPDFIPQQQQMQQPEPTMTTLLSTSSGSKQQQQQQVPPKRPDTLLDEYERTILELTIGGSNLLEKRIPTVVHHATENEMDNNRNDNTNETNVDQDNTDNDEDNKNNVDDETAALIQFLLENNPVINEDSISDNETSSSNNNNDDDDDNNNNNDYINENEEQQQQDEITMDTDTTTTSSTALSSNSTVTTTLETAPLQRTSKKDQIPIRTNSIKKNVIALTQLTAAKNRRQSPSSLRQQYNTNNKNNYKGGKMTKAPKPNTNTKLSTTSHSVTTTTTTNHTTGSKVTPTMFLKNDEFSIGDMYSGMWWQSVPSLLEVNTTKMTFLEAATFVVAYRRKYRIVLFRDILNFCVEHLSTYFRYLRYDIQTIEKQNEYQYGLQTLQNYSYRTIASSPYHYIKLNNVTTTTATFSSSRYSHIDPLKQDRIEEWNGTIIPSVMRSTIAIIPFGLKTIFKENADPDYHIRYNSLLATIVSMWQIGIGRIVVVGITNEEEQIVQSLFQSFYDMIRLHEEEVEEGLYPDQRRRERKPFIELAFVGDRQNTKNLPKEAISGLQYVLAGFETNVTEVERWLGTSDLSKWKYVYFTEPDLIVHTRPETLKYIAYELQEKNSIIMAHRLQLVQHGSDYPNIIDTSLVIPALGPFKNVTTIDSYGGDQCLLLGDNDKAAFDKPKCRKLWWRCGFGYATKHNYSDVNQVTKLFRLYVPFQFMRLQHGTGFVVITGTQHRQICQIIPKE